MLILPVFALGKPGVHPGRGCGVITPFTTKDHAWDIKADETCVLVKDGKLLAKMKKAQPSKNKKILAMKCNMLFCHRVAPLRVEFLLSLL